MDSPLFKDLRPALVIIDLQRGIVATPTAPHSTQTVIANATILAEVFRNRQLPVFLIRVTPSLDRKDALTPILDNPQTAISYTSDWADIVPELGPLPSDIVITKRQWGAFYSTELDLQLRRRRIDTIVLCGISTNIGVESTARSAYEHGYQQIFAEDACAARSKNEHTQTFKTIFPRLGRIRTTKQIVEALHSYDETQNTPG